MYNVQTCYTCYKSIVLYTYEHSMTADVNCFAMEVAFDTAS